MQAGTDHKQAISDPTAPELTVDGVVATVRFRKPALANRLSPDDLATLRNHIDTVNREKGVLVLRFMGEGKYFCSGYDISSLAAEDAPSRSEEHTSELQSLMRISYAVFCLKKKKTQ